MTQIRTIQVLRAIAVLGVVLVHVAGTWEFATKSIPSNYFRAGAFGVDLFFVISGFIIYKTAEKATSPAEFLRNRFIRVAPLFYIISIPWLVLSIFVGEFPLDKFATTLTFWPLWGADPTFPFLKVGWSLSFEALFYTAVSLSMLYGKKGAYPLLILFTGALALNATGAPGVWRFIGNPLLLEFLAGVVIARTSDRKFSPPVGAASVLVGLALIAYRVAHGLGPIFDGLRSYEVPIVFLRVVTIGPGVALIVWGALQLEPWCKGALVHAVSYLGDASYSTYLIHPLVIYIAEFFVPGTRGAELRTILVIEYVVTIVIGLLTYQHLEKPLLAYLRRKPVAQPAALAS